MSAFKQWLNKVMAGGNPSSSPQASSKIHGKYAEPENYDQLPHLTLTKWNYGRGRDDNSDGYGFITDDNRIWTARLCTWSRWEELGVMVINTVGAKHHLDDLNDSSFEPGQPLRLYPESDNPHDPKAIAIRNWACDRTAGYVKKGSTSRLRNLLEDKDIKVMALNCKYDGHKSRGRRESMRIVIYRPDCLSGADHVPVHSQLVN